MTKRKYADYNIMGLSLKENKVSHNSVLFVCFSIMWPGSGTSSSEYVASHNGHGEAVCFR